MEMDKKELQEKMASLSPQEKIVFLKMIKKYARAQLRNVKGYHRDLAQLRDELKADKLEDSIEQG